MRDQVRRVAPYILTAVLVWIAATSGPSLAAAAYDALNARKVDGLSAVKSSASAKHRAGKLVAADKHGRLPDSAKLGGLRLERVRTQWLSVNANGIIYRASPGASGVTVTHPATGTYCISSDGIDGASMAGNVQSNLSGFEDLTMTVTSLYNTGVCPNDFRIYTAHAGALADEPFTLTFALY